MEAWGTSAWMAAPSWQQGLLWGWGRPPLLHCVGSQVPACQTCSNPAQARCQHFKQGASHHEVWSYHWSYHHRHCEAHASLQQVRQLHDGGRRCCTGGAGSPCSTVWPHSRSHVKPAPDLHRNCKKKERQKEWCFGALGDTCGTRCVSRASSRHMPRKLQNLVDNGVALVLRLELLM